MILSRRLVVSLGCLALLAPALSTAGCGEDLGSTSVVDRLRTIAIRADKPEAAPGTSVHLEALVIDPRAGTRDLDNAWFICVTDPGETAQTCASANLTAVPVLCAVQPEAKICLASVDASADYVLPERALTGRPAGDAGQVIVTHIVGPKDTLMACAESFSSEGKASGECQITIKRLTVSRSSTPNQNPIISDLRFDGQALDTVTVAPESKDHMLTAVVDPSSTETLPVPKNGATTESLFVAWYTSPAGDIAVARTEPPKTETKYQAPGGQGPVKLIAVVHDDRGGVSWVSGSIRVQ